jgi:uncharacterized protein YkwD
MTRSLGTFLLVTVTGVATALAQPMPVQSSRVQPSPAQSSPAQAAPARAEEAAGASRAVLDQVNALRTRNGLPALAHDALLARAADDFAQYMARTGRYGHEADGRTPSERAQAHGYAYCIVDENIGWIERAQPLAPQALGEALYEGWQGSPPHRQNMLDPDVVDTGVGVARRADGRWYAVQLFGRPRTAEIVFSITDAGAEPVSYRLGERTFNLHPGATRVHRQCR